jgi:hypothetical protein
MIEITSIDFNYTKTFPIMISKLTKAVLTTFNNQAGPTMSNYTKDIDAVATLREENGSSWNKINPESVARMRAQNKFKTGLDIAQYTADIMRADMAAFDKDKTL